MANALHRTTLEYRRSVNDPDFSDPPWLLNPDISAVAGVPNKYWKLTGDVVSEMTQGEKDAVDAAEAAALTTTNRAESAAVPDRNDPLGYEARALIELLNKRDNYLTTRLEELQAALVALQASAGNAGVRLDALPSSYSPTATRPRSDAIQDYKDEINSGGVDT